MKIKMIRLLVRIINYLSFKYCGDDLDLGCPLWLHQGLCCLYAWLQFGNKTQLENENRPRTKIKILWLPSSFPGSKFLHMSALLKMVSTLNLGLKFVHQFERIECYFGSILAFVKTKGIEEFVTPKQQKMLFMLLIKYIYSPLYHLHVLRSMSNCKIWK